MHNKHSSTAEKASKTKTCWIAEHYAIPLNTTRQKELNFKCVIRCMGACSETKAYPSW